ncbi:RrF2 family transcriptional regulator [Polycladomyces zharkentensis]|uniref:RrF2 family transcriptional regulator n=1 Tax=Polycladomyces zharkentensis TaxID=2807616 RepID=UPI00265F7943|nr:Rrf2 family transcriptional regulator [Polycladomyces sp. WAk]
MPFIVCSNLMEIPPGESIGIKELAKYQGVSETYLSKIFTKLKNHGLLQFTPGVKGGYKLAKPAKEITFWDVISAIHGTAPLFHCREVRQKCLGNQGVRMENPCLINQVMLEAEERMRAYLRSKTLYWLYREVKANMSEEQKERVREWFREALASR